MFNDLARQLFDGAAAAAANEDNQNALYWASVAASILAIGVTATHYIYNRVISTPQQNNKVATAVEEVEAKVEKSENQEVEAAVVEKLENQEVEAEVGTAEYNQAAEELLNIDPSLFEDKKDNQLQVFSKMLDTRAKRDGLGASAGAILGCIAGCLVGGAVVTAVWPVIVAIAVGAIAGVGLTEMGCALSSWAQKVQETGKAAGAEPELGM